MLQRIQKKFADGGFLQRSAVLLFQCVVFEFKTPTWVHGIWQSPDPDPADRKETTFSDNGVTCPATLVQDVQVDLLQDDDATIRIDQYILIKTDSTACIDYDNKHEGKDLGPDWALRIPIKVAAKSSDTISFEGDMQAATCKKVEGQKSCAVPGGEVAGTIRQAPNGTMQVDLVGPVPGSFILVQTCCK